MGARLRAIDRCKYERSREPSKAAIAAAGHDTRPTLFLGTWRGTRRLGIIVFFALLLAAHFVLLALLPLLYDDHDVRASGSTLVVPCGLFVTLHIILTMDLLLPLRYLPSDITSE